MANIGDDALAAGMQLMTGNEPARTLDEEMNLTRDYIARRTNAVTPVNKGGTGAQTADAARVNLGLGPLATAPRLDVIINNGGPNQLQARWEANKVIVRVDNTDVAWLSGDPSALLDLIRNGYLSSAIYNRGSAGQWRSLAVQADGTLAHTASAARFKENVTPLEVTDEQVRAFELVEFDWIESGYRDVGLIADAVEAAGLGAFVFHDDDGEVLGIHYERVALALLPVVQRLISRVEALEARDA